MPSLMNSFFRTNGQPNSYLYDTAGTYSLGIPAGEYRIICRGAGGAGGATGATYGASGGKGGAGAKGELVVETLNLNSYTTINIYVGQGGLTKSNGGNGGAGGSGSGNGGAGGGGGNPSYITWQENASTTSSVGANGGGGGGGGGGGNTTASSRLIYGSGGGGGGGYYQFEGCGYRTDEDLTFYFYNDGYAQWMLQRQEAQYLVGSVNIPAGTKLYLNQTFRSTNNLQIEITRLTPEALDSQVRFSGSDDSTGDSYGWIEKHSILSKYNTVLIRNVDGKTGGNRGAYASNGQAGENGNFSEFYFLSSGAGGTAGDYTYVRSYGGAGAIGGGASGGGGASNGRNEDGSSGGCGGGGAGGSADAGGGAKGNGGLYGGGSNASNHHTSPTDISAENAQYGASATSGRGGATNENGNDGFVYIQRIG